MPFNQRRHQNRPLSLSFELELRKLASSAVTSISVRTKAGPISPVRWLWWRHAGPNPAPRFNKAPNNAARRTHAAWRRPKRHQLSPLSDAGSTLRPSKTTCGRQVCAGHAERCMRGIWPREGQPFGWAWPTSGARPKGPRKLGRRPLVDQALHALRLRRGRDGVCRRSTVVARRG